LADFDVARDFPRVFDTFGFLDTLRLPPFKGEATLRGTVERRAAIAARPAPTRFIRRTWMPSSGSFAVVDRQGEPLRSGPTVTPD
jgi:hypothetical protein